MIFKKLPTQIENLTKLQNVLNNLNPINHFFEVFILDSVCKMSPFEKINESDPSSIVVNIMIDTFNLTQIELKENAETLFKEFEINIQETLNIDPAEGLDPLKDINVINNNKKGLIKILEDFFVLSQEQVNLLSIINKSTEEFDVFLSKNTDHNKLLIKINELKTK